MSSRPVTMRSAVISKTWTGSLKVAYQCPWCNRDLASDGREVLSGSQCPNCGKPFHFDEAIQTGFLAEQQGREEGLARKQAEAHAREQQRQEREKADLARQQAEVDALKNRMRASDEASQRMADRQSQQYISDLSGVRDLTTVLLVIAGLLCALAAFISTAVAFSADRTYGSEAATLAAMSAASALGALVGVFLMYSLFRCLFAVHGLLLEIKSSLDRQSPKDGRP